MNSISAGDQIREGPDGQSLAGFLGLFSIALGAAEMMAPRSMARLIGLEDTPDTESRLRAFGAREIGSGIAILMQPQSSVPVWSRVAGDALDLAVLGANLGPDNPDRDRTMAAAAAVLGVTALDVICAQRLDQQARRVPFEEQHGIVASHVVTVNRPIEQVWGFWRRFENHPQFMRHLVSVETLDQGRSRWRATGPAGVPLQWEAEITDEQEHERLSWRSIPGSMLQHRGTVHFRPAPGARGTDIHIEIEYRPPAGSLGRGVGWLFGQNPEQQLHEDLRRFKQLLETGEIAQSDGPALWRAAQPSKRRHSTTFAGAHE